MKQGNKRDKLLAHIVAYEKKSIFGHTFLIPESGSIIFQRKSNTSTNLAAVAVPVPVVEQNHPVGINSSSSTGSLPLTQKQPSLSSINTSDSLPSAASFPKRKRKAKTSWHYLFKAMQTKSQSSPNSLNSLGSLNGINGGTSKSQRFTRSESMAYPGGRPSQWISKMQYHARQNTMAVISTIAFAFVILMVTSNALSGGTAAQECLIFVGLPLLRMK